MRRHQKRKKRLSARFISFMLLVSIAGLLINLIRPLPQTEASVVTITSQIDSVNLNWPQAYAALGAQGFGVLETHGSQAPRPTASIAKIITVLAILEKHPLKQGEQGPTITLTDADIALFNKYFALGGSYVKVEAGEKITEYQALEAMLLPSANNMADGMAIWAFGSMEKYLTYANSMVKHMELAHTAVATDASGFSPDTTSTPSELVQLGQRAMANPVIAEIVQKPSAVIPVHGIIYSANSRLGPKKVIGIKTGLTDEAGGCFLFAQNYQIDGKQVMLIGAIMGGHTLLETMNASVPLLNSAKSYFAVKTPVRAGEPFATLTTPWLASAQVVAKADISLVTWRGTTLTPHIELAKISGSLAAGTQVGTALIASGTNVATTPLVLRQPISGPTWTWRLKRF